MLDTKKMERCKQRLIEQYFSYSIIESSVDAVDFSEKQHGKFEFQKFGIWKYLPKEWFTDPANYPDFVFSELGRGIATGEKNYLIKEILGCKYIEKKEIPTFEYSNLTEIVNSLASSSGFHDCFVLFMPIKYFTLVLTEWAFKKEMIKIEKFDVLDVNGHKLKVIWSNKYVEFDEIILAIKTYGQWIAKPTVKARLDVSLFESEQKPFSMELKAQTAFNFKIINPEHVRMLHALQPLPLKKLEK